MDVDPVEVRVCVFLAPIRVGVRIAPDRLLCLLLPSFCPLPALASLPAEARREWEGRDASSGAFCDFRPSSSHGLGGSGAPGLYEMLGTEIMRPLLLKRVCCITSSIRDARAHRMRFDLYPASPDLGSLKETLSRPPGLDSRASDHWCLLFRRVGCIPCP